MYHIAQFRTAYAYNTNHRQHTRRNHPENHRRLEAILNLIDEVLGQEDLIDLPPLPVTEDTLTLAHHPHYIEFLKQVTRQGSAFIDPDTYVTPDSFEVACHAVGCVLSCAEAVVRQETDNAFALIRPPGHHACPERAMGFCLLNNIAIATRWLQQTQHISRPAIIDFDVHHGNGTQQIFYHDPSVFYISLHQFPLYPGTGLLTEIGVGEAKGTTLNIPLPAGTGDGGYLQVLHEIVIPALHRFSPDFILLSAGYDAHWRDPLAQMRLTVTGFAHLITTLHRTSQALCQGRLVLALEGGYDIEALAYSVIATLKRLKRPDASVSDPFPLPTPSLEPDLKALIQQIKALHDLP